MGREDGIRNQIIYVAAETIPHPPRRSSPPMTLRSLLEKATGKWKYCRASCNATGPIRDEHGRTIAHHVEEIPAALIVALHSCADELLKVAELAEMLAPDLRNMLGSEEFKGIFIFAHAHGNDYDGPEIDMRMLDELDAALRALREREKEIGVG